MSNNYELTETPDAREKYLQYVTSIDINTEDKHALIDIVHAILSYFVDQAFCMQTDQITLWSNGKINFNSIAGGATVEPHPQNLSVEAEHSGPHEESNLPESSQP